ncbi:hypothetical protein [Plantactinospora sonchi]|uniref:ABC transporter permease n=1 Tax=Plantactinospora sonchi TaxID=1544735 RepID=A0ABU7RYW6_9ACTN
MIAGLALADFRDRVRRPAYAAIVLAAVGLGYLAAPAADAHWVILDLAGHRGVYDSAYTGAVTAVAGALWLMFGGFYVVRGTIRRDERTGVGQVLAATPVSRLAYLMGKFGSNLLVLASMTGVLAVTALVMQLARAESRAVDPVALLAPFVLVTLPVLAVTAAAALLFDTVRPLNGGIGNIAWFFVWMVLAIVSQMSGALLGGLGVGYVADSVGADLAAQGFALKDAELGLGLMYVEQPLRTFDWSGLDLSAGLVADRVGMTLVALAVAAVPALWFHRFDTARRPGIAVPAGPTPPPAPAAVYAGLPRTAVRRGNPAVRLFVGELRILVQGVSRWWWLGTGILVLVGLAASPALGLLVAGIWPVLIWSRLGTQPAENNMGVLLGAYPAARRRLLAEWAAGLAVAALVGTGPTVRMLVTGDVAGLAGWGAGAVFVASLALALGVVGRTQRLFQAAYVPLWYLVLNDVAALDYLGAVRGGPAPVLVAGAGAVLLAVAVVVTGLRHARR